MNVGPCVLVSAVAFVDTIEEVLSTILGFVGFDVVDVEESADEPTLESLDELSVTEVGKIEASTNDGVVFISGVLLLLSVVVETCTGVVAFVIICGGKKLEGVSLLLAPNGVTEGEVSSVGVELSVLVSAVDSVEDAPLKLLGFDVVDGESSTGELVLDGSCDALSVPEVGKAVTSGVEGVVFISGAVLFFPVVVESCAGELASVKVCVVEELERVFLLPAPVGVTE